MSHRIDRNNLNKNYCKKIIVKIKGRLNIEICKNLFFITLKKSMLCRVD